MTVQVFYSDQPGQDPTFHPRGACEDWDSAVALVRSRPNFEHVRPRAVASPGQENLTFIYSAGSESYKLEGPPPGPQD